MTAPVHRRRRRRSKTADKAIATVVTMFTAWCAKYGWGWLAGLEAIGASGYLAWKIPNTTPGEGDR